MTITTLLGDLRDWISLCAAVYYERIVRVMGPERDPLIDDVEISILYVASSGGKRETATLSGLSTVRDLAGLSRIDGKHLEDMLPGFSGVPKFESLIEAEMVVRYRHPARYENSKVYTAIFDHRNPIHFPIYPPIPTIKNGLTFSRRILQATLTGKDPPLDVTDTITDFAGPKCDFYRSVASEYRSRPTLNRILWDVRPGDSVYSHLHIMDTFGTRHAYDLDEEFMIEGWPPTRTGGGGDGTLQTDTT